MIANFTKSYMYVILVEEYITAGFRSQLVLLLGIVNYHQLSLQLRIVNISCLRPI